MRKKYQKNFVYPVILKFYIIFLSKKFINGLDKKPYYMVFNCQPGKFLDVGF